MPTIAPHRTMIRVTALLLSLVVASAAWAQNQFTIIALPDTQNYVDDPANAPLFTQQTQWISNHILVEGNPRNIKLVTHLGDMVSDGSSITQYMRADTSMSELDGGLPQAVIPYSVLPGNHDYASTGDKSTGTNLFLQFFGPSRFLGYLWYQGSDPSGNNSYQVFTAAGRQFLHIALEYQPSVNVTNGPTRDPSPIEWAQSVLSTHPGLPTILSTHEHIDDDPAGRSGTGEVLWNELIRINDQIIMVLNGHHHSVGGSNDGEYHQISQNAFGKDVVEALQNFQDYPNGGDGWLRIITFDIDADTIHFETYTPVLDQFQTETVGEVGGFASDFTINMDFDQRFLFEDPPQPPAPIYETLIFEQGVDGYAGTHDKEIRSSGGDEANGKATEISVDGDDGEPGLQPNHALIRFDDILTIAGARAVGIDTIENATLELNVTDSGSGFEVYPMLVNWDETTTWADLGGNGITPGIDCAATPIVSIGADTADDNVPAGTLAIDITDTVRNWLDGADNFGLGFVTYPSGTDGVDFTTSESVAPPRLTIRKLLPGLAARSYVHNIDGYVGATDTQLSQGDPGTSYAAATVLNVDTEDPNGTGNANQALLRFDAIFGPAAHQTPVDAPIVRATLFLTTTNDGVGGFLHRMLIDWNDTDTWAGAFAGNGVQADDIEAAAASDTFVAGIAGIVEVDVTDALRDWQASPASNSGWVLLPTGSNGWDFASAEAAPDDRPRLVIVIDETPPCPSDIADDSGATPDGTVDVFDLLELLTNWTTNGPGADITEPNNVVDIFDLLELLASWGDC